MKAFICSFTGSIGDMKKKDQRDPMKVLAVLSKDGRFSVFDATESMGIANSLDYLKSSGFIEYKKPQPEYPWSVASVTEAGRERLAAVAREDV